MKLELTARAMSGQRAEVQGELVDLTLAQRAIKALSFAGAAAAVAVGALFIPVVHFVLPPLAALTGVIGGVFIFTRTRRELRAIHGTCPACAAAIEPADARAEFPMTVTCPACEQLIQLQPIED